MDVALPIANLRASEGCIGDIALPAISFFAGQQMSAPELVRGRLFVLPPGLATLALMAFWLLRVWLAKAFGSQPLQTQVAA